jgi:hypothetical protein
VESTSNIAAVLNTPMDEIDWCFQTAIYIFEMRFRLFDRTFLYPGSTLFGFRGAVKASLIPSDHSIFSHYPRAGGNLGFTVPETNNVYD